jgi:predicted RNA-binding protein YlxR (DUF448 family)
MCGGGYPPPRCLGTGGFSLATTYSKERKEDMKDHNLQEVPTFAPDKMPGFFDKAMIPLNRKSDRFGNIILTKPVISSKHRNDLEKKLKADMSDSAAEVKKLMSMKKTAEIDAMGFDPANQGKEIDVVIILKRVVMGKPEFILKSNKKEVIPEISSQGGVTWAYVASPGKKAIINAIHSIRLTEQLIERLVKRKDGKYEVVSKDGSRSFGVFGSEEKAKKRLQQIEFFKQFREAKEKETLDKLSNFGVFGSEERRSR